MKSSHQKILIIVLAVLALGWAAWNKFEWVEERRWVKAEAAVNNRPMLAAGLFLESLGFSVSRIVDQKRFDDIPDTVDTLFICEGKQLLSRAHFQELERWLTRGGHLVVNSSGSGRLRASDDEDEEAEAFGIRSKPLSSLVEQFGVSSGNVAARQDCWRQKVDFDPESSGDDVDLDDVIDALSQEFSGGATDALEFVTYRGQMPGQLDSGEHSVEFEGANWLLRDDAVEADWLWQSPRGSQLISQNVGRGRLTVLSDFSPFFNQGIGTQDNAFALQSIVQSVAPSGSVVWFHERELAFPSLLSVLWKRAPQVLLFSLVAILLAVWAFFARREEPRAVRTTSTSQLRQQLYSLSLYRWRVGDMQSFSQALENQKQSSSRLKDGEETDDQQIETLAKSKGILIEQARAHWHAANKLRGDK